MNPDRAIGFILTVSLAAVLALGIWMLRRGGSEAAPPPATPSATPSPQPVVPTVTPASAAVIARGYRLAGTVVGDLSYAIVEDPSGGNQLYRPGQTIPELGEVIAIEENRITLAGSDGNFYLNIAPAPTTTPTMWRPEPTEPPEPPDATPVRRRPRDRSESESSP